ncbi:MAG: flagellar protein FlgN [Treponema sp.]|jgi:hypothetical protein|nr:flagellar protein FlgN [Treponema sp.]
MAISVDNAMVTGTAALVEISPGELAQRVAVLRRFKLLLQEQRERFYSYLEVLDKQQDIIESGGAEELLSHVELEEKIVADIFSIQKVIDPLDNLYHAIISGTGPSGGKTGLPVEGADEVSSLKAALEDLKNEAVIRSSQNRELLTKRMVELRSEITALRNNPYAANVRRSSFSNNGMASLVDIEG